MVAPTTFARPKLCLLYTSDAADERSSVDLGGRRIIKKNIQEEHGRTHMVNRIEDYIRFYESLLREIQYIRH